MPGFNRAIDGHKKRKKNCWFLFVLFVPFVGSRLVSEYSRSGQNRLLTPAMATNPATSG